MENNTYQWKERKLKDRTLKLNLKWNLLQFDFRKGDKFGSLYLFSCYIMKYVNLQYIPI